MEQEEIDSAINGKTKKEGNLFLVSCVRSELAIKKILTAEHEIIFPITP